MLLSYLKSSTSKTYLRLEVVICLCLSLPIHPPSLVRGHSALLSPRSLFLKCSFPWHECVAPSHHSGLSSLSCSATQSTRVPHFLCVTPDHIIQFHFSTEYVLFASCLLNAGFVGLPNVATALLSVPGTAPSA